MSNKSVFKSKTAWSSLALASLPVALPYVEEWAKDNIHSYSALIGFAFFVLRMFTSGKIEWKKRF